MDTTRFSQLLTELGTWRRKYPGQPKDEGFEELSFVLNTKPGSCPDCMNPKNQSITYEYKFYKDPPFWKIKCTRCKTHWKKYKE